MTWLDHLVCGLVDQAAIQSVPEYTPTIADFREVVALAHMAREEALRLRAHLEAVLRIVGRGEYRSQEDQAVIGAAREAVR